MSDGFYTVLYQVIFLFRALFFLFARLAWESNLTELMVVASFFKRLLVRGDSFIKDLFGRRNVG